MTFAQIKNGVVKNVITLDDITLQDLFAQGFDYFIRIDTLDPHPGVRWLYDAVADSFTAPPPDLPNP